MKHSIKLFLTTAFLVSAISGAVSSSAAVPDGLNYQAYLSNADGTAFDGTISITFAAYTVDIGGVPVWTQTESGLDVEQGLFSVTLGNPGNPFPPGLFETPVYIGLFVAGEEMLPRRMLTTAPYAFKASDANTLTGATAADLDQTAEVAAVESDVASLGSDVASLGSDVAANETRITDLELTGADITGVTAGPGLTGGGVTGNVTVNVATGGIVSSMLAPNSVSSTSIVNESVTASDLASNSVGAAEIQPGAVGASEIATDGVAAAEIAANAVGASELNDAASFTMAGLTVNGTTNINGALTIDSFADIRILDSFNGFRWYNTDGVEQFAAFLINGSSLTFQDYNENRPVLYSNTSGIGIGTSTPSSAYGVTMPSLIVTGGTNVGLERVFASYVMSSTSSSCHSHGNLTCYYGSGTVSCPVGKRVVGGGASGTSGALFGSISRNYPNSTTSWACSTSYDLADVSRSCYALCARLE